MRHKWPELTPEKAAFWDAVSVTVELPKIVRVRGSYRFGHLITPDFLHDVAARIQAR